MNWDRIQGNWMQARARPRELRGRPVGDVTDVLATSPAEPVGRFQERFDPAPPDHGKPGADPSPQADDACLQKP